MEELFVVDREFLFTGGLSEVVGGNESAEVFGGNELAEFVGGNELAEFVGSGGNDADARIPLDLFFLLDFRFKEKIGMINSNL